MVFTQQQSIDLSISNLLMSADESINTHNDVNTSNTQLGQTLEWNGSNWVNTLSQEALDIQRNNLKISATGSVGTHSDVTFSSPATNDVLTWDGVNWRNIHFGNIAVSQTDINLSNIKSSADGSINTHVDVDGTGAKVGDVLSWNGVNWIPIRLS